MARINSPFVGSAKGKLGDGIYTTRFGETIVRAYQPNVYNPRTIGQLNNRIVMASAAKLASVLNQSKYKGFYKPTNNAFYVGAGGNQTVVSYTQFMVSQLRRINVAQYLFTDVGEGNGHAGTAFVVDPDTFLQKNPSVLQRIYYGNGSLTPPVVESLSIVDDQEDTLSFNLVFNYNWDSPNAPDLNARLIFMLIDLASGECVSKVSDPLNALDPLEVTESFTAADVTDQTSQPFGVFYGRSLVLVFGFIEQTNTSFADSSRIYPMLSLESTDESWSLTGFDPFLESAKTSGKVPENPSQILDGGMKQRLLGGTNYGAFARAATAAETVEAETVEVKAKRGKKKEN